MGDNLDPKTRSRIMSAIRGKNTRPELLLRKRLHASGLRYRLHVRKMPGRPDLVFPRFRAVVFVNGCFWHGHDCRFFRMPSTRRSFWSRKIRRNRQNDRKALRLLRNEDWRCMTVWECAFRGQPAHELDRQAARVRKWILDRRRSGEIRGRK